MRQKQLHSILFTLFLSCCLLLVFAIINIIENSFKLFNVLLIVIILSVAVLIGKRLPKDIEERGNWMDDEQMFNFIEIILFHNKERIKKETQVAIDTIQSIHLIREDYSWTLCVKSLKSVNYIERITFSEKEIIDKLVKKGFVNKKDYHRIVNRPRTFKIKVIDYFDFIGFPKFELYRKREIFN